MGTQASANPLGLIFSCSDFLVPVSTILHEGISTRPRGSQLVPDASPQFSSHFCTVRHTYCAWAFSWALSRRVSLNCSALLVHSACWVPGLEDKVVLPLGSGNHEGR